MDDLLVVLALVVGGAALIIPIVALAIGILARSRSIKNETATAALTSRLDYLEKWTSNLAKEVDRLRRAEAAVDGATVPRSSIEEAAVPPSPPIERAAVPSSPTHAPPEVPSPTAIASPATASTEPPAAAGVMGAPSIDFTPPPPSHPTRPKTKGPDLEGLIGVRLFAWLGGAVLFIAAALFLQYSIEHELISPPARVAIGLLSGTAFLLGGDALRKRADRAGQALSGAGLGVLYASLYAAHALYDLLPTTVTFIGMALVTAAAGALAVRRSAYVLAVLGLVGGFATPLMLSTGENRPVALFAYVAMLDIGVVFVALRRRWHSLLLVSSVGSTLLFAGWAAQFLDETSSGIPLLVAVFLGAIFMLPSLLGRGAGAPRAPLSLWERAVAALGATLPFFAALAVASSARIDLEPGVLVAYLLVLTLGATFVSFRADLAWLPIAAPPLALLVLVARVDSTLFPAHRIATLVWLAVPPAFALALAFAVARGLFERWLPKGASTDRSLSNRAARIAAGIALASAPFLLVRILSVEPPLHTDSDVRPTDPLIAFSAFTALHWVGLACLAATTGALGWLAAAIGVSVLVLGVLSGRYEPAVANELAATTIVPMLALWGAPLALRGLARDSRAWLLSGIALAMHFPILYAFTRTSWPGPALAASAVGCAMLSLFSLRFSLAQAKAQSSAAGAIPSGTTTSTTAHAAAAASGITAALGAITLGFITLAVPIALENQWLTVAWGAEAAALAWLHRRVPHNGLVWGCAALAAATFTRLVANPWLSDYEVGRGMIVLNWLLYTFGIPIVAFFAASFWLHGSALAQKLRLSSVLQAAAGVLAFVLLNLEIADAFGGTVRSFRLSGDSLLEDMTYSLGWGLFALLTLVIGIVRNSRGARAAALGVLVLTFGKVFLHDLSQLGSLYRVGSMLGLAIALLVVSLLLQRFVLRKPTDGATS